MEVGSLVKYKAAGFIGIVIETATNGLEHKPRVRVHWISHHNETWWIDQILVEVLCK